MAAGRREGACLLDEGPHRSSGTGAEHAAEDRQPGQGGARLRGQHRRWTVAVPRLPRRRRHHDGLRRFRRPRDPFDLRESRRWAARRGVRGSVHGDHPCGRQGRARRRLHPGHHRRHLPAHRRRALGRRAGGHRPRARHRAGAGGDRHAAGHRLHLVERHLRQPARPSSTRSSFSSPAWPTTC